MAVRALRNDVFLIIYGRSSLERAYWLYTVFWTKIVNSISLDGWFVGKFFGVNESCTVHDDMTFHTAKQARKMLEPFDIVYFHEEDEEGRSTIGPRHWHNFTV